MKRATILILILAMATLAVARDKKPKVKPGPYVFSSKASAQTLKGLIVQENLRDGYTLDSDDQLQFRFSKLAQMPLYGQIFMASSACPGTTTKQVWSYTLVEHDGTTKVTVQPAREYPDDYCTIQTNGVPWSKPEEMVAFQAMLDKAPAAVAQTPAATHAAGAPAVAQVPAPNPGTDQQQEQHQDQDRDNVRVKSATPPAAQPKVVAQDDPVRREQQHQACMDLAKDNPSITCK
jgi:hypothetical protein